MTQFIKLTLRKDCGNLVYVHPKKEFLSLVIFLRVHSSSFLPHTFITQPSPLEALNVFMNAVNI